MSQKADTSIQTDRTFHTYDTHHIPWYVRLMWVAYWIGAIWYVVKYAIPMAKNYY